MNLLEELRLRRWARENYVPPDRRPATWNAVALDEMRIRDGELAASKTQGPRSKLVPLAPVTHSFDCPHLGPAPPHFLSKPLAESVAAETEWGCYFG